MTGDPAPDLELVDVVGVVRVGDLQRGPAGVEDHDPAVGRADGQLLGEPELVPVEADGLVEVGGGHDEPQLVDGHGPWLSPHGPRDQRRTAAVAASSAGLGLAAAGRPWPPTGCGWRSAGGTRSPRRRPGDAAGHRPRHASSPTCRRPTAPPASSPTPPPLWAPTPTSSSPTPAGRRRARSPRRRSLPTSRRWRSTSCRSSPCARPPSRPCGPTAGAGGGDHVDRRQGTGRHLDPRRNTARAGATGFLKTLAVGGGGRRCDRQLGAAGAARHRPDPPASTATRRRR